MREKVQPILEDIELLFQQSIEEENYELSDVLKGYIDSLKRFMHGELEYADILDDVLEICVQRYEILKVAVIEQNRYVLFSAFGNWMFFWIDTLDRKSPLWEEIIEAQKKQEEDMMNEISRFHRLPVSRKEQ